MKKLVIVFIVIFTLQANAQNSAKEFTNKIETKHRKSDFMSQKFISYDISVSFGGNEVLKGNFTQNTGGGKIKLTKVDGSVVIFDGKEVYGKGIPEKAKGSARFHIFTWPYFLGLPYKLNDGGTVWSEFSDQKWGTGNLATGKLSFESGTGDAPDDWYIVYKNEDHLLEGAAYIVSYGKGKEAAEKEPHAIKYNDYEMIEGIPFSKNWTFHMWSLTEGYTKEIGLVKVSNIQFLTETDFTIPEGSMPIPNPNK